MKHRSQIQRTAARAAKILPWADLVASNLNAWRPFTVNTMPEGILKAAH